MQQSLIGSKWLWNIVSIYSRKVITVNKHEDSAQCLGFSRLTPTNVMGPCCQIPNHHPGYLLQSLTVEIEMYFPNQSWFWDGISTWSHRHSVGAAWGPESTQKDGVKELCWKVCLHIVYPIQCVFLCLRHDVICLLYKLTSHSSLWTLGKTKSPSSPHMPRLLCRRWIFMLVPISFSLIQGDPSQCTQLVKFFYTCSPTISNTRTCTLDMMSLSLDLRILSALNMAQFTFCLKKLSNSPADRPWALWGLGVHHTCLYFL